MYIIFDTETTGLPSNFNAPITEFEVWPRMVQLAWQRHDYYGGLLDTGNVIVKPDGWEIPPSTESIHGISNERAMNEGKPLAEVLELFQQSLLKSHYLVGHNLKFDLNIVGCEYLRLGEKNYLESFSIKIYDTSLLSTDFCKLMPMRRGQYKWPKLTELYQKLFNKPLNDAHDAAFDVEATARSFFALVSKSIINTIDENEKKIAPEKIAYQAPKLENSNFNAQKDEQKPVIKSIENDTSRAENVKIDNFAHLHVHTDFSPLRSSNEVNKLVLRAKELKMKALAITDFGTMSGVFQFVDVCNKNKILPIIGCELHWSTDYKRKKFTGGEKDEKYSIILLAKNEVGYQNLCKLSSIANVEGFYYVPRVSKELIEKHSEGLIALSGNIKSEIPHAIFNKGKVAAEKAIEYWKSIFGDDFYLQINRLGEKEEEVINSKLIEFSEKYKIKTVACNESYYLYEDGADILDILYSIKVGRKHVDSQGNWNNSVSSKCNTYFFKSKEEMADLFKDIPESLENINEVVSKIEKFDLRKEVKLPQFDIPNSFENEYEYLKHLTFEGAKKRYQKLTDEIIERIDFELNTIKKSGYSGYFLIVQDFIAKAREMSIDVGPGRGSAAGSVVAYCLQITNVDPLKYGLLFERFLNPDRISLPDIDIDFDDTKRGQVIKYVVDKYGKENVCQIITFLRLKTKLAIKDVGRVLDLSFAKTTKMGNDISNEANDNESIYRAIERLPAYKKIFGDDSLEGKTLVIATEVEGLIRNVGVHACGVIIAPKPISDIVPITTAKDADLWITQYDAVEDAGLLKMDILGLKTLSVIRDSLNFIQENHNVELDTNTIPLTDEKTLNLFQKGLTGGIFQFESDGMRKYLISLKPDKFEDLIAMNALYRPGPMQYIPSFIKRKRGTEEITYDRPEMEEILKETYGITVYQEQVMLLSQKLAGFSGGEADTLRKAMGKKNKETLATLKNKFKDGCTANGIDENVINKIWHDWEEFANYAFNKSHSTCYALLAYQTAYLKANYPVEFMTAVMKHNSNDLKKLSMFILECKKMGINVFPPHVNFSKVSFSIEVINEKKGIRFGLEAVKGIAEYMSNIIVEDRKKNGDYVSFYDFCTRDAILKESLKTESMKRLIRAGILDNLKDGVHRKQLLNNEGEYVANVIKNAECIIKEKESNQPSLFGGKGSEELGTPKPDNCTPYTQVEMEQMEYKQFGTFLSSHPLDNYKWYIDYVLPGNIDNYNAKLEAVSSSQKQYVAIGGLVLNVSEKNDKKGNKYLDVLFADFYNKINIFLYENSYKSKYEKYKEIIIQGEKLYIEFELSKSTYSISTFKKVISIRHLKNVVKTVSSLNLELNTKFVSNDDLSDALVSLLQDKKFSGQVPLYISLYDEESKTAIKPRSKSVFLDISEDFISILEKIKTQCLGDIELNFNIAT